MSKSEFHDVKRDAQKPWGTFSRQQDTANLQPAVIKPVRCVRIKEEEKHRAPSTDVYTISHPVRKRNGYIYLWLVHDQWRSLPFHKPPKEDGLIYLEETIQEDKNRGARCGDSPMPFRGLFLSARLSRQFSSPRPPPRDTNRSWLSFYESVPAFKLFYGNRCMVCGRTSL